MEVILWVDIYLVSCIVYCGIELCDFSTVWSSDLEVPKKYNKFIFRCADEWLQWTYDIYISSWQPENCVTQSQGRQNELQKLAKFRWPYILLESFYEIFTVPFSGCQDDVKIVWDTSGRQSVPLILHTQNCCSVPVDKMYAEQERKGNALDIEKEKCAITSQPLLYRRNLEFIYMRLHHHHHTPWTMCILNSYCYTPFIEVKNINVNYKEYYLQICLGNRKVL